MPGERTSLQETLTAEQQARASSMSPRRLDTARERIAAVCAEYNHFNPTYHILGLDSPTLSCAGEFAGCFYPPGTQQLKNDLQTMVERFLALDCDAADNAYRRISLQAWEAASDEYCDFDLEKFRDIIRQEVKELNEDGCYVDVSDLATLWIMPTCF